MSRPKKSHGAKKLIIVFTCLALMGCGFFVLGISREKASAVAEEKTVPTGESRSERAVPAALVQTAPVILEERFQQGFESSGTLEAFKEVTLQAKVSGRLAELKVSQGERVEKGQIVAELDHRDQDAQVAATRAQIAVAQAQQAQAKATLDEAKREFDRYRRLLKEGYATQQEVDSWETSWQSASAAYRSAGATVQQYRAALQSQEVIRSEYILEAPIAGTVLDDYSLTTGTMIATSTAVVKIGQVDVIKATLNVPENRASRVKEGMKALLSGESFPGLSIEGRVYRIRPYVDTSTRSVEVEVTVDNEALGRVLKPGMFARVFLVEGEAANALSLPTEALREGNTVLVVEDGRACERVVEVGLFRRDRFQVISGLEEGDEVVIVGGNSLGDGDPVLSKK